MITILASILNYDPEEGLEYETFSVRVAEDIDDLEPIYCVNCGEDYMKALEHAEEIDKKYKTEDIIEINV